MAYTKKYDVGIFSERLMAWCKLDIYSVGNLSRVTFLAIATIR